MEEYESCFAAFYPDRTNVTINVYRTMVSKPNRGGDAVKRGRARLETEDGQAVNPLGDGRYELVDSGIVLTSDDPTRFELPPLD